MAHNTSSEEGEIRDAAIAWGRRRWPDARVVNELVVGHACRIDVAFISPAHLAGIEIKSSKDTLDRLETQLRVFTGHIPEVWLAFAPKWLSKISAAGVPWNVGQLLFNGGCVDEEIPHGGIGHRYRRPARPDECLTIQLLDILWRDELHAVANTHDLKPRAKAPIAEVRKLLVRKLTGEQIIAGVCTELRGRDAKWVADPPIGRIHSHV